MTLSAVFHPQVLLEINAARHWYERLRPGLGDQFATHIARAIELVLENPMICVAVLEDIRRVAVPSFPYHIYYERVANDLMVFGVFHSHRNPQTVLDKVTGRKTQL